MPDLRRQDFPEDFIFGTATSAYQIEGHAHGGAGMTHWDSFAATPGNVTCSETGAYACDHYHRYAEDLDLVRNAGFDAYRFSISWARLLPDGTGTPSGDGLAFYDRLIDGMLERGLKPALTLYHWELPSTLADQGGWCSADMAKWFGDYTDLVGRHFGDRLWSIAPINEPWCVGWLSHFMGHHAPGLRDIRAAARAMHHILVAHGTAIQTLRARGLSNLGAVCNFEYAHPATDDSEDIAAAQRYDALYNRFFVSAMMHGCYPELALTGLEPYLPAGWESDWSVISEPVDWLGLNYYTCKRIAAAPGAWPNWQEVEGPLPKTDMGWEIYPQGLDALLQQTRNDYTGNLPLYVTENGMANADYVSAGCIDDLPRIAYHASHLDVVRKALANGVPLRGYFLWSLLDNYEWAFGYDKRFGLVHVDFENFVRTPKRSYATLRNFLRGGAGI